MVQQLQEQADRTIRFNTTVSDAGGVEITDTVAERSNKVLAYDNAGDLSVANELGEWKGNWATSTAFTARDLVLDAATNNVYICLVAHTSGTLSSDVSASKWALVINAAAVAASAATATTKHLRHLQAHLPHLHKQPTQLTQRQQQRPVRLPHRLKHLPLQLKQTQLPLKRVRHHICK